MPLFKQDRIGIWSVNCFLKIIDFFPSYKAITQAQFSTISAYSE